MKARRGELRLSIARGYWALGEHDDALSALERGAEEDPGCDSLREFASSLEADGLQGAILERLTAVRESLLRVARGGDDGELSVPRISTPTLAELLAQQGHADKALR